MPRRNIAVVRRTTNRLERPSAGNGDRLLTPSPREPKKTIFSTTEGPPQGKVYYPRPEMDSAWMPNSSAVIKLMISLRLSAALWSTISDCDEVYNYWEPLHLLLYGKGFQTWEYSPIYAIRSYFYIYLHYLPANVLASLFTAKIAVFIIMRCLLAILCLAAEFLLFKAISERICISVARFFILFSILSTGMFISCSAFLPSTFAMVLNMFAMAAYLKEKWLYAIFCTAASAMVGWPFAALLGIPIVIDMVFIRSWESTKTFIYYAALSGLSIGFSMLIVDYYYYGKHVLAPLNIVLYNVFSGHGPDLYGIEPVSFYIKNLVLNWNFVALLAPLGLPLSTFIYLMTFKPADRDKKLFGIPISTTYWQRFVPVFLLSLSLTAWMVVFFSQPHKEERFLFPVYPLLALLAAIALDAIQRLLTRFWNAISGSVWIVILAFIVVSLSRVYALHWNFAAHMEVYKSLNEHLSDVDQKIDFYGHKDPLRICVGKEWYRFPSSFFLPDPVYDKHGTKKSTKLYFLKSEFSGLLPKYYEDGRLPDITRRIPTEMNDLNLEEKSRYVEFESCDYLVDLDSPPELVTDLEPNYGLKTDKVVRIASHPFLVASQSHWLLRAFYVPFLTPKYTRFTNYSLYKIVR